MPRAHSNHHPHHASDNGGERERLDAADTGALANVKAEMQALARQTARETYPPMLVYLAFLCVMYGFMCFEPFGEIASLQHTVKGTSSARV